MAMVTFFGDPAKDRNRFRHFRVTRQIEAFLIAVERYKRDCGQYPTTNQGLDALISNPVIRGWRGPYLPETVPLDPWGNRYL